MRPRYLARFVLAYALPSGLAACGPGTKADFVRTDNAFTSKPAESLPPAYIDELPERPFHSVGVIEVIGPGASLRQLVEAARQKAMDIGCDAIIERNATTSGIHLPPDSKRWVVEQSIPLRRSRSLSPALSGPRSLFAATTPVYIPQPVFVPVGPVPRREFLCVLFDLFDHSADARPSPLVEEDPRVGLGELIWSRLGGASCDKVAALLEKDSQCTRSQCAAPLALAEEFLARCAQHEAANKIDLYRERWTAEPPPTVTCIHALKRAPRSKEAAANYASVCLKDREPGAVEARLLGRPPQ